MDIRQLTCIKRLRRRCRVKLHLQRRQQRLANNCICWANMNGVLEPPDALALRQHSQKRKRQLEDELQVIQQQRAALEQRLQALNGGVGLGAGPAKVARGPNKIGAVGHFGAAGVVSDRAHIEAEREKRVTALFQQCQTILRNVKGNQKAGSFLEPVDPVKLKILDYFQFVKKPMALSDVWGKLNNNPTKGIFRKYKNVYEFRDDMRQIWENCRLYNPIGQPVRTNGDWMSEYWEKKWATSGIEQKWEEEMLRQRQEEMVSCCCVEGCCNVNCTVLSGATVISTRTAPNENQPLLCQTRCTCKYNIA